MKKKSVKKTITKAVASVKKAVAKKVEAVCIACGGTGLQDAFNLCTACGGKGIN